MMNASMAIDLSEARRPIFVATLEGDVSDQEYEQYLKRCDSAFFVSPQPYALIYDGHRFTKMGPGSRQMQSAWINRNRLTIQRYCKGVAFILESSFQRGVLAAAHMVSPPPYAFKIFSAFDAAMDWTEAMMDQARISAFTGSPGDRDSGLRHSSPPSLRSSSTAVPSSAEGTTARPPRFKTGSVRPEGSTRKSWE
jgi:hypothetical protein